MCDMRARAGNNTFLKKYNEIGMLDLIRRHGSISKADLSRLTGLSATASGMIVSALQEKGYIREAGEGESRGGRKPVMLELNPHSIYSIGVDIDVNYLNVILMDITGNVIDEHIEMVETTGTFPVVLRKIEEIVALMLEKHSINSGKLTGLGISVPGLVDSATRRILMAPNLGWEDVDVCGHPGEVFGVPVYVENEAMASAICEHWIGACKGYNDFVCINIKSGIGAGIFAGGHPYRGVGGIAGEIGHVVIDDQGPKCGCGKYGCLETLASALHITEKARKLVRQGAASSLNTMGNADEISIEDIVKAARAGDATAKNILLESGRYLGIAISNIVNMLNPAKIVLGKEFTRYADIVLNSIREIVNCKALKPAASEVEIVASGFGEKASALGAAIVPMKLLFGR